jgi:hypothetical protein
MTKQDLYEFIRDNVSISVDTYPETDYGRSCTVVKIRLLVNNPETDKSEVISTETFTMDHSE